ncbi:alpha/beta-hydrolase [Trametopsis cervina]|nr:alpha/beta-hydrolase [Trametopsis cervina]
MGNSGSKSASITTLPASTDTALHPFAGYASAAYCSPASTLTWSCGANCELNPGFVPYASGGDGVTEQSWFVGYDPALDTVISAHQGTDPSNILDLLEDVSFTLTNLDSGLFPGIDSSIKVHSGFAGAHALTAADVLEAVTTAIAAHGASHVSLVGHSLGGALSLLDAVYFPLHLPSNITYTTFTFGLPRVGNQAFADYIDNNGQSLTHVTNKADVVPILPGRFLGFVQASGEVHIEESGDLVSCPGQDNTNSDCIAGAVSTVFDGSIGDHDGPYAGVTMGC